MPSLSSAPAAPARAPSWLARTLGAWQQGLRLHRRDALSPPAAPSDWRTYTPAPSRVTSDFWPLIENASHATGGAAAQQALCELHGSPPGQPMWVRAAESDLQALLAHLSAISQQVLGTQVLPRATARVEAGHAVLHWGESGQAEDGLRLARLFTRLSSLPAAPTPADVALHCSVQWALRITQACGGRLYASASPLALMRLTARLPLAGADTRALAQARP